MTEYINELYYDKPIPYKELLIYPVTMKDYLSFHWLISCLLLDKNSIPDIDIISMSYLRFLYHEAAEKEAPYVYMIKMLLCLVLPSTQSQANPSFLPVLITIAIIIASLIISK